MNQMKKMIFALALCIMALAPASAQNKMNAQNRTPEQNRELRAERMAHRLMLSDAATAQFTPLYKEYLQEMANLRKDCPYAKQCPQTPQACGTACGIPRGAACATADMSDAELEKFMEQRFDRQQKKLDIQKKYYKKLKSVLTPRQLQQVFCPKGHPGMKYGKKGCPQGGRRCAW